jgi:glycosyltransferase involved in cell wall biosynthesis
MKLAFFSALPFGVLGSPGTYKLVDKCRDYFDLVVFAPPPGRERNVFHNSAVPVIPVRALGSEPGIEQMVQHLKYIDPDIIYIFNFPFWYRLLLSLKKAFPRKKYVLDIKSPLLAEGSRKKEIQSHGEPAHILLDTIFTPAAENVATWIPHCSIKPVVYPLGIDLDLFDTPGEGRACCRQFVYIGLLHEKRRLDLMINFFSQAVKSGSENVTLDIYGTGPDHDRLRAVIAGLSMEKSVRLCGLVPQDELMKRLSGYDAGIAWVPYEEYDTSPSLKVLEYMAAGLPVLASDTTAHQRLAEQGASIDFFCNTPASLCQAVKHMAKKGFSQKRVQQNLEAVKPFDFHAIIQTSFFPVFKDLVTPGPCRDDNRTDDGQQTPGPRRILFIGPQGFRPGIWETRARYILPDLFDAVPGSFKIHFLTAPVPEFARKELENLCQRYGICHFEAHPMPDGLPSYEYWRIQILSAARQVRPDVITNVFGPVTLGAPMGLAAREVGARTVLRVAGDEIQTRISLGTYDVNPDKLDIDLAQEAMGAQLADTIIAMSPLEKERICRDLPPAHWHKVVVCIRGIDLSLFSRTRKHFLTDPVKTFLYIGRQSLEKGYDIAEAAAARVFAENSEIEVVFAGSFERMKIENRNYIGWVDSRRLQSVFSTSDAYLMTSRSEGFPQVVAEAMATGLPCILPRHLFENLMEDGKQALLCDLDPEHFAQRVLQLNKDRHLAETLSREARIFAETRLDKRIWTGIYRDILSGGAGQIHHPLAGLGDRTPPVFIKHRRPPEKKVLKMVIVLSEGILSAAKTRQKVHRFMIEMSRRNHLVYLFFPRETPIWFLTWHKVIYMPFSSHEGARTKIQGIDPDLLIASARPRERNACVPLLFGWGRPVIWLELLNTSIYGNRNNLPVTVESASSVIEEEVILSSAGMILTSGDDPMIRFPQLIQNQVDCFPRIDFQTDGDEDYDGAESMPVMGKMTRSSWEAANEKEYDAIENKLFAVLSDPPVFQRIFSGQLACDPEKALHVRRMRQESIQASQDEA